MIDTAVKTDLARLRTLATFRTVTSLRTVTRLRIRKIALVGPEGFEPPTKGL
jgi:hypothetical protein